MNNCTDDTSLDYESIIIRLSKPVKGREYKLIHTYMYIKIAIISNSARKLWAYNNLKIGLFF